MPEITTPEGQEQFTPEVPGVDEAQARPDYVSLPSEVINEQAQAQVGAREIAATQQIEDKVVSKINNFETMDPDTQQELIQNERTDDELEAIERGDSDYIFDKKVKNYVEYDGTSVKKEYARDVLHQVFNDPDDDLVTKGVNPESIKQRLMNFVPKDAEGLANPEMAAKVDAAVLDIKQIVDKENESYNPLTQIFDDPDYVNNTDFRNVAQVVQAGKSIQSVQGYADDDYGFFSKIGRYASKAFLDRAATELQSPAFLLELQGTVLDKIPYSEEIIKYGRFAPTPFAPFLHLHEKNTRKAVIDFFRNNAASSGIRSVAPDIPDDLNVDIMTKIRGGNYGDAAEHAAFFVAQMGGDIAAVVGTALLTQGVSAEFQILDKGSRFFRYLTPSLFGLSAAEESRHQQIEQGQNDTAAILNSAGKGVIAGVMSDMIVLEKMRGVTRLVSGEFGVATGREFAKEAIKTTAKNFLFDGSLMATGEGLNMMLDYATDINPNAYDDWQGKVAGAFILGGVTSLAVGGVTRPMHFSKKVRAAKRVENFANSLNDIKTAIETSPNAAAKEALITKTIESGQLGDVVYVKPSDLAATFPEKQGRIMEIVGLTNEHLDMLNKSNAEVPIPMDVFLREGLAGEKDITGMVNSTRLEPGGPNVLEAVPFNNAVNEFFDGIFSGKEKLSPLKDRVMDRVRQGLGQEPRVKDAQEASQNFSQRAFEYVKGKVFAKDVSAVHEQKPEGPAPQATQTLKSSVKPDGFRPSDKSGKIPRFLEDPISVAFGEKFELDLRGREIDAKAARTELNKIVKEYGFDPADLEGPHDQFFSQGKYSDLDLNKIQTDTYGKLLTDDKLNALSSLVHGKDLSGKIFTSKITGERIAIDRESVRQALGKEEASKLFKKYKTLFPKELAKESTGNVTQVDFGSKELIAPNATKALSFEDAISEVGLTKEEFVGLLKSKDASTFLKYPDGETFLQEESVKSAHKVQQAMERYKNYVSDDKSTLSVDNFITSGKVDEALSQILDPGIDKALVGEIDRIENSLKDEFQKRDSRLVKIQRPTKELSNQAFMNVLNLNHNFIRSGTFIKQALEAERVASVNAARAIRNRDFVAAYEARGQQLWARTMLQASVKAHALLKSADRIIGQMQNRNFAELAKAGYDVDFAQGIMYAMSQNGIKIRDSKVKASMKQLSLLRENDPVKFDKVADRINRLIPSETNTPPNAFEYVLLAERFKEINEFGKQLRIETLANQETINVGDIANKSTESLLNRDVVLHDAKTNGNYSKEVAARVDAVVQKKIDEGVPLTKIDKQAIKLEIMDAVKDKMGLAPRNSLKNSLTYKMNSAASSLKLGYDYLYNLKIPELSTFLDHMRDKESRLRLRTNSEIAPFNFKMGEFVNANAKELAFRGKVDIGGSKFSANEVLGLLLHSGNESNFEALSRRNFGVEPEVMRSYLKKAIADGVITKKHFEFVQQVWDKFGSYLPETQKAHKELFGTYFNQIESKFQLGDVVPKEWGEFKGGYAPLKLDKYTVGDLTVQNKLKRSEAFNRAKEQFSDKGIYDTFDDDLFNMYKRAGYEQNRAKFAEGALNLESTSYLNHLDTVLRTIELRKTSLAAAELFTDVKFQSAMNAVDRTAMSDVVLPWLKHYADQSNHQSRLGDMRFETASKQMESVLYDVMGRSAAIQLGFNMKAAVTNYSELFKVAYEAAKEVNAPPGTRTAVAMSKVVADMGRVAANPRLREQIRSESPYMLTRWNDNSVYAKRYVEAALRAQGAVNSATALGSRKLAIGREMIRHHARIFDHTTQMHVDSVTYLTFRDKAFAEAKRAGMSDAEATAAGVSAGERAVQTLQPGYAASEQAKAMHSPYFRFFNRYSTWAIKQLSHIGANAKDINYRAARDGFRIYGEMAPLVLLTMSLPVIYDNTLQSLWYGNFDSDNVVDDFKDDPMRAAVNLGGESLIGAMDRLPLFGRSLRDDALAEWQWLRDYEAYTTKVYNGTRRGFFNIPEDQVVTAVGNIANRTKNYLNEDEFVVTREFYGRESIDEYRSTDQQLVEDLLTIFGWTTGVPAGPGVRKPLKFLTGINNEDEDPETFAEYMQGFMRGYTPQEE